MILLDELADVVGVLDDNSLIVDDDAGHADLVLFPHLLEGVLGVAQLEEHFQFSDAFADVHKEKFDVVFFQDRLGGRAVTAGGGTIKDNFSHHNASFPA